jgi:hypothetical protein
MVTRDATRQRRRRQRQVAGLIVLGVEVSEADVHAALCEAGLLSPLVDAGRRELAAALALLLGRILRERHA